jgi:hypothetical protein
MGGVPGNNGAACNSPNPCLVNAACNNGTCGGGMPGNDGAACNSGNACLIGTTCSGGVCGNATMTITQCINGDGCCPPGCNANDDSDCAALLFPLPGYDASVTFQDALMATTMGMAWDGTSYWSCSGGDAMGNRLTQYTPAGVLTGTYQPGIDFRSIFTQNGDGSTVYERAHATSTIQMMFIPGVFGAPFAIAGPIDPESNIVLSAADELVAMSGGTVTRWTAMGATIATFSLNGFAGGEDMPPQNRGIVVAGGYYLTYYNGLLTAWDGTGTRLKATALNLAGTSNDSYYSFSYANHRVWIVDVAGGTWRGYDVGL